MDDSKILRGVQESDEKFLFASRIEQDLLEIKHETERLEGEIQKYERLIQTLDLLPRELSWSLPHIALTKHALLPNAELINTNEITVHIGDNWFTRCSAHHAKGICTRRQDKCRDTISALRAREKMLLSWQKVMSSKGGMAGGRESVSSDEEDALSQAFVGEEIREFMTEEEYEADKEIHKQRVKEHYQKKREMREKKGSDISDDDFIKRLEELELEEQMSGELRSMDRSQRSSAPAREIPPKKKSGGVKFADEEVKVDVQPDQSGTVKLGWMWDDGRSSSSEESSSSDTQEKTEVKNSPPRRLSFAQHIETGSDETSVIEFSHTPVDNVPSAILNSTTAELKSPSDIYESFQEMFAAAAAPKSILKQPTKEVDNSEQWPTLSYPFSYIQGDLPSSDSEYEDSEPDPSERQEVLSDIVEKVVPAVTKEEPAVTKEEPDVTKEEPDVTKEEPDVKKEECSQSQERRDEQIPVETQVSTVVDIPVKNVGFADEPTTAEPPCDKQKVQGNKKMSKFKSSRMASKKK